MKKWLFNITVYAMLGWSIISAIYMALPVEYQEMFPQMNWITALVSGGSTLLLGTGGLAVQAFLTKAKADSNNKYALVAEKFLEIKNEYQTMATKYNDLKASVDTNNQLLKIELNSKLSNPLIDSEVKAQIEGALYGKQEESE